MVSGCISRARQALFVVPTSSVAEFNCAGTMVSGFGCQPTADIHGDGQAAGRWQTV